MNALEKYITKTKLASALREKIAQEVVQPTSPKSGLVKSLSAESWKSQGFNPQHMRGSKITPRQNALLGVQARPVTAYNDPSGGKLGTLGPKHVPKIPPKRLATLPLRKKLQAAKPRIKWTGLRTPVKTKVLAMGPKSRPLVIRKGGDMVLRRGAPSGATRPAQTPKPTLLATDQP